MRQVLRIFGFVALPLFFCIVKTWAIEPVTQQVSIGGCKLTSQAQVLLHLLQMPRTYVADYEEYTIDKNTTWREVGSGSVYVKFPNKLRWVSVRPEAQWIISDGTALWRYDLALDQAVKQPLTALYEEKSPIGLLLAVQAPAVLCRYRVHTYRLKNVRYFVLEPRSEAKATHDAWVIELGFQQNILVSLRLQGPLEESSLFTFTHRQVNSPISDKVFQFKPKPSTDVLS